MRDLTVVTYQCKIGAGTEKEAKIHTAFVDTPLFLPADTQANELVHIE